MISGELFAFVHVYRRTIKILIISSHHLIYFYLLSYFKIFKLASLKLRRCNSFVFKSKINRCWEVSREGGDLERVLKWGFWKKKSV